MTIIRWQPWQEMETVRRQMDELFDEIFPVSQTAGSANGNPRVWAPAIDLKDTDTNVILKAELPGLEAKDLNVQVTREAVSISGEHKSETKTEAGRTVRSEFRYGSFHRVIPLPTAVYNDRVNAEFKDGILILTLPKVEADRPQVVKVNLDSNTQPLPAPESKQTETGDVWTEAA